MQYIKTVDCKFYEILGLEIRKIRQHKRLTLKQLSLKTGFSLPQLDRWELGVSKIRPDQFEKLCSALGLSPKINIEVHVDDFDD